MAENKGFSLGRSVTLGELLTAAVTMIVFIVTAYTTTQVRISLLEKRMEVNEQSSRDDRNEVKESLDKIITKVDALNEGQNQIRIDIQNKADKKND